MRRYTLTIGEQPFVIDVQELAADRFEVLVDGESYEVTLSDEEHATEASITPTSENPAPPKAAKPAARKGTVNAPMPGVILEISVKAGDRLERGQPIAILDAMKMHNVIGAPRAGTVAEVFVSAGQTIDHGEAIISFAGD